MGQRLISCRAVEHKIYSRSTMWRSYSRLRAFIADAGHAERFIGCWRVFREIHLRQSHLFVPSRDTSREGAVAWKVGRTQI